MTQVNVSEKVGNIEWSGQLSRATPNAALFSLYLAMHCQPGAQPLRIATEQQVPVDNGLEALNHYRRSPLKAEPQAFEQLKVAAELVNQGDVKTLGLWLNMHPDPLSPYNDNKRIPPEVITNCSFATQQSLRGGQQDELQTNETFLDDIISGSQQLLAG